MILLSLGLPAGAIEIDPRPYQWTVTSPSGVVSNLEGKYASFVPDEDGNWKIHLAVYYLHQSPYGPLPWVAVTDTTYHSPGVIFTDGFENGTTSKWSQTIG